MGSGESAHRGTRIPSDQERLLMEAAKKNGWPMMELRVMAALDTAMRRGELLKVKLKDIDFKQWRVSLSETKSDEFQFAYIETERLREALIKRRFIGPDGYVFGTEDGRPVSRNTFLTDGKQLFEAAGVAYGRYTGVTWHDFKHEFCSHLAKRKVQPQVIQRLARHKSFATTLKYLQPLEEDLREGASEMEKGRDEHMPEIDRKKAKG
jgi:integrase